MPRVDAPLVKTTVPPPLKPYWTTVDGSAVQLWLGDVHQCLAAMPARSVHCCVTSPPYWGLRDYGTASWDGGDAGCDHLAPPGGGTLSTGLMRDGRSEDTRNGGAERVVSHRIVQYSKQCLKCGAHRVDSQIGSEESSDCGVRGAGRCGRCFVCVMVNVFRGVRRVLRDDGVLWINLGDSYTGGGGYWPDAPSNQNGGSLSAVQDAGSGVKPVGKKVPIPSGNLLGMPWRVALALQADGWVLRSDIIWVKSSPMPESVTNRPAKALEYVFMLVKSMDYWYDHEATKRQAVYTKTWQGEQYKCGDKRIHHKAVPHIVEKGGSRNFWNADLWFQSVAKPYGLVGVGDEIVGINPRGEPLKCPHFAAFPSALIEPFILASTSAHGCCPKCGKCWDRVVDETKLKRERPNTHVKRVGADGTGSKCDNTYGGTNSHTVTWSPGCACGVLDEDGQSVVVPCTVLDPFIGSGTTCCVALRHGLRSVGIDLSEQYLKRIAVNRVTRELNKLGLGVLIPHASECEALVPQEGGVGEPQADDTTEVPFEE